MRSMFRSSSSAMGPNDVDVVVMKSSECSIIYLPAARRDRRAAAAVAVTVAVTVAVVVCSTRERAPLHYITLHYITVRSTRERRARGGG